MVSVGVKVTERVSVTRRGNNAGGGSVDQSAGDRGRSVQLGRGERGSVSDARRGSPGDHWSGLGDDDLNGLGGGGVVGGVGRCEGD